METDIDIKNLLGMVRRQIWIIATSLTVVVALTILYLYSVTPLYTATALVIVDPAPKNLLKSDDGPSYVGGEINTRVDSEVQILNSDNSILKVIKDKNLIADPEFGVKVSTLDQMRAFFNLAPTPEISGEDAVYRIMDGVQSRVTVKRVGLTSVIEVSFRSKDPAKAADLANALVQSYIDLQLSSKIAGLTRTRDNFSAQVIQANANIVQNEKKFDEYLDLNLAKIEKSVGSSNISAIRNEMEAAKKNSELAKTAVQNAEVALQGGNMQVLIASLNSDALKELQKKKDDLNSAISKSVGNSDATNLRQQLQLIDAKLNASAKIEINKLKNSISEQDSKAADLRGNLRSEILKSNLPPEVLADIYTMQQNSQIAQTQYQTLLSRQQELDIKAQLVEADSRIANLAIAPMSPSFPNKRLVMTIALFLGAAIGVGIAVLREYFVGGFISEEQASAVLGYPLGVSIPRQGATKLENMLSIADKVVLLPLSVFAESMRRLRIRIETYNPQRETKARAPFDEDIVGDDDDVAQKTTFEKHLAKRKPCRVVMVASSEPNEGKSTVALALARTIALSGNRVLLIDCDLRKPSVHKMVGIEPNSWFSQVLRKKGHMSVMNQIENDPMSNLKIITNSREHDAVTDDLVMGSRFEDFISIARKHFDYVVFDTPPVVPVVDALYIARHVDIVAFVVRWAHTSQQTAKRSLSSIVENMRKDAEVVIVMNQKEEITYKNYNKYSDYYGAE